MIGGDCQACFILNNFPKQKQTGARNKSYTRSYPLALVLNYSRYQIRIYEKDLCRECIDPVALLCHHFNDVLKYLRKQSKPQLKPDILI